MKTILLYGCAALLLVGCSKEVTFLPDSKEELKLYSQVYMPRAERPVTTNAISITGEEQTYYYNAYLGGPTAAPENIEVTFAIDPDKVDVFNQANGTNYVLLPAEAYTLESASGVITKDNRTTGDFTVKVKPGSYLAMFESYLLPISIVSSPIQIRQPLATTYLVFTVTYIPGQVPRERVLQLGSDWGTILSTGARGGLVRKDLLNNIWLHEIDTQGHFSLDPRIIATNFSGAESFYYVNDSAIVVRNFPPRAPLFNFVVNANHDLVPGTPRRFGDYWNQYILVPYKDYFLTIDVNGILRRQPALSDISVAKTQVGAGFNIYKQVLAYKDYLLALEADGKLWLYTMSADAVPGARRQVGEGWDLYDKIIVSGDDILALEAQGDVYRYKFNPKGFYPLK